MSDHVHPYVRRKAREVDADRVRCANEKSQQHKIIFEDSDDFDVPVFELDDNLVDVHSVQTAFTHDGVEVTVFLNETATVRPFEQSRMIDGELCRTGIDAFRWDGERYRGPV